MQEEEELVISPELGHVPQAPISASLNGDVFFPSDLFRVPSGYVKIASENDNL